MRSKFVVNYEIIGKYAEYLKKHGFHGVQVNGWTGEGSMLTVDERKRIAEEWYKYTQKYQLKMMLNIGGAPLPHVYELAEHAEKLGVDAFMFTSDTFYVPKSPQDLVAYFKDVAKYAPSIPALYYHIPFATNVYSEWRRPSHD